MTTFCYLTVYASDIPAKHSARAQRLPMPAQSKSSIGDIAGGLFDFAQNVQQMFKVLAIVTGGALILFSISQYKKHRQNPVETPLSTVIMTLVIGLSLIALSFVPMKS